MHKTIVYTLIMLALLGAHLGSLAAMSAKGGISGDTWALVLLALAQYIPLLLARRLWAPAIEAQLASVGMGLSSWLLLLVLQLPVLIIGGVSLLLNISLLWAAARLKIAYNPSSAPDTPTQPAATMADISPHLDGLRRYHRHTLSSLPIGLCAINQMGEIYTWNPHMLQYTGITERQVLGQQLSQLPSPGNHCCAPFIKATPCIFHAARW